METYVKNVPDNSGTRFYLVEDENQSGLFISAIVSARSQNEALRIIEAFAFKEFGDHTKLVAKPIDIDKAVGVVYSVIRK